jgi:hypothetical protein
VGNGKIRPYSLKGSLYFLIPVLGAVGAGSAALFAQSAGFSAGPDSGSFDAVTAFSVSGILLGLLFYGMKRHPEKSARLIIAGITVAGTISGLVLLKVSLQAFRVSPIVFLLTLPVGYLGLNWSVKGYFGSLSENKMRGLMMFSATLLGALIGTSLPTVLAVMFLLAMASLDTVLVGMNTMENITGLTRYEEVVSVVTLPVDKYMVGLGDFLAYSILASASLRFLGLFGAFETSILILAGVVLTFQITKMRKKAPGLVVPIILGLIPLILGLTRV